jgi:GTPase SAR1 family protein
MSIAGIRSNRGDKYQTFIAFDWALTVLSDPEVQWLEVDSTNYLVDDVVIGKSDGSLICCQCKKNQSDFRAWSITDLSSELEKAIHELDKNKNATVCFYSRSDFGVIAKLREFSTAFSNEADYYSNMTAEHTRTNDELSALFGSKNLSISIFEFLHRISFEVSPDFPRLETLLRERLRRLVSNSEAAYDALWRKLDELGARIGSSKLSASTQCHLTKEDLKFVFHQTGAMLVPEISITDLRKSFARTSSIGRTWKRDIADQIIPSILVVDLLSAIEAKKRSVLLTGPPGSGKTCIMLRLQELLEHRAQAKTDVAPIFIQTREFADLDTAQERQAQGLSEQWVEQAARLAEDTHVIVVIDSLDTLSIAREHSILSYFLAQIDQLLLIPNVTVVTACRNFDRQYDRRIAVRQWDSELKCLPLDWDDEVVPLLEKLKIEAECIDTITRELIRNPRELALFVELVLHQGSFSVITGQALAQRYLDLIVQNDNALGDQAMHAIEALANEMLSSRSLSAPKQRFNASQKVLRRLQSLNVLLETKDGKLTFGHQTLMDVLVISSALRQGLSLKEFIDTLPPVPFVRPSLRSFVAQLATGKRREFRKQMRAVFTSNVAFHIRRLIAESYTQQIPHDDDWPMIQELRKNHREVFQVVYTKASLVEWHYFWLSHLVPALKKMRDADGMITHVNRVKQWVNEDIVGISTLWMESLSLDWLDGDRIADQLIFSLKELKTENLPHVVPLLEQIINIPQPEHSLLGHIVARCITSDAIHDKFLWRYIAGDIREEDVIELHFNNKLHCHPHEFGDKNENFLKQRMVKSTSLLDLALADIVKWSQIKSKHYGESTKGYRFGFLYYTSYEDYHSETDHGHIDSTRILFDAIEAAILDHSNKHSNWWQQNRQRLCTNHEGALCFFAILALTKSPQPNIDLIGQLLCDKNILKFDLSYEISILMQTAFIYLDNQTQSVVNETIQTLWEEKGIDDQRRFQILKNRSEYISAIPCHLRSDTIQVILDEYEKAFGKYIRQPFIRHRGGYVFPPFSYEVFLNISDNSVIHLLKHYSGYENNFDDLLVGGDREVGLQLQEVSSLNPSRFLNILYLFWNDIAASSRDNIMDGVATHLLYRYGNLQTRREWIPIEEPIASNLARKIINELERHSTHWQHNRSAAKALKACAHVIQNEEDAERFVFLTIGFSSFHEENNNQVDSNNLTTMGINMMSGIIAEALIILANKFQERGTALPEMLPYMLRCFATKEHPAIRAMILIHLPFLQNKMPSLGWELFHLAMQNGVGLWQSAERCLYYAYKDNFTVVEPMLNRIIQEGEKKDFETWGRISALSVLAGHINYDDFLEELQSISITEAWHGAASVWTYSENLKHHRVQCLSGIEDGLKADSHHAMAVVQYFDKVFRDNTPSISLPIELIQLYFRVLETNSENKHPYLFGFGEWLNAISQYSPDHALAATEIYVAYISRTMPHFYDHENRFAQLMTLLFAEAEEREESDHGRMIQRVVAVQDQLLSIGVNSINDWLVAAERQ